MVKVENCALTTSLKHFTNRLCLFVESSFQDLIFFLIVPKSFRHTTLSVEHLFYKNYAISWLIFWSFHNYSLKIFTAVFSWLSHCINFTTNTEMALMFIQLGGKNTAVTILSRFYEGLNSFQHKYVAICRVLKLQLLWKER